MFWFVTHIPLDYIHNPRTQVITGLSNRYPLISNIEVSMNGSWLVFGSRSGSTSWTCESKSSASTQRHFSQIHTAFQVCTFRHYIHIYPSTKGWVCLLAGKMGRPRAFLRKVASYQGASFSSTGHRFESAISAANG